MFNIILFNFSEISLRYHRKVIRINIQSVKFSRQFQTFLEQKIKYEVALVLRLTEAFCAVINVVIVFVIYKTNIAKLAQCS